MLLFDAADPQINVPDSRWERPAMLLPGRKPVGPVQIDPNHKYAPDVAWLFSDQSRKGYPLVGMKGWQAGYPGEAVIGTPHVKGIASASGTDLTVPTRWSEGGSITFVVAGTSGETPNNFGVLFTAPTVSLSLSFSGSATSLNWRVDAANGTFSVTTNIKDGKRHVVSLEWPANSVSGPYQLRIDGLVEASSNWGTQGEVDFSSSLTVNNRAADDRDSGLIMECFYMASKWLPGLHHNPYQFLRPA